MYVDLLEKLEKVEALYITQTSLNYFSEKFKHVKTLGDCLDK